MTIELLNRISLILFIVSGCLLIISALLFFVLKIPKIIGDITGKNAKKAIELIRDKNVASGNKAYKSSSTNLKRGKLTDKISGSGKLSNSDTSQRPISITEKITTQKIDLGCENTTVLNEYQNITQQLRAAESSQETTVLYNNFHVEYEEMFTVCSEFVK